MIDLSTILATIPMGGIRPSVGDLILPAGGRREFLRGEGLRSCLDGLLDTEGAELSGWILWSEELQIIDGTGPDGFERGWVLAAELHRRGPDGYTIEITQSGRDWVLRRLERSSRGAAAGEAFLEVRELLPWPQLSALNGRKLRYEIAWRKDPAMPTPCFRPAESRFVGFSPSPPQSP